MKHQFSLCQTCVYTIARFGAGVPGVLFPLDMKNLLLTFCLLAGGAFLQPAAGQVPSGGGPQPGGGAGTTGVPIDGGAYALKRLRQRRQAA